MQGEILTIVRQTGELVLFDVVKCIGERHIAMGMMMSIAFAVGGNMHELCGVAFGIEMAEQSPGEILATEQ